MSNKIKNTASLLLENSKCPCGEGVLILTTEKRKHLPKKGNNILEGDWYVYRCTKCGEGWTTTNSDEISIKNLKTRKI